MRRSSTATGAKTGGEILAPIASNGIFNQWNPEESGLADGGFALTWREHFATPQNPDGDWTVKLQLYNVDRSLRGGVSDVNTSLTGAGGSISIFDKSGITTLADGSFVVAWTDRSHSLGDSSGSAIFAQLYSAAGTRIGGIFEINAPAAGDQLRSRRSRCPTAGSSSPGTTTTYSAAGLRCSIRPGTRSVPRSRAASI